MRDLRYALRTLLRSPVFSATVVLTLALGIGASTAVFGAMDRLLLRRLPYAEPDRLVALHETQTGKGFSPVSLPNLMDWRAQSSAFDGMAGFMTRSFGLRGGQGDVGYAHRGHHGRHGHLRPVSCARRRSARRPHVLGTGRTPG